MPSERTRPLQRRSMLHRWHRRNGAEFVERGGALMVARYTSQANEDSAARRLGICDLTAMPRTGVTGPGATEWLAARGLTVPETPNRAVRQTDADALARLSRNEYLLLGTRLLNEGGSPAATPVCSDLPKQRVYALPRLDSHCCLALTGVQAVNLLSKICAVDLRPHVFADGDVAQTEVAHLSAIVVRHDLHRCPCFLVLVSSVAAEFAFEAMLDAMIEFNGTAIGLHALQSGGLES